MEEKDKKNEEEKTEGDKKEGADEDADKGDKSEADKKVEQLNADTKRINQAIAENENAKARQKVGGVTENAPIPDKKKEEVSDKEYAEKALSGEFNAKK